MATLARELRNELERTVKQARRTAEVGAHKAVEQMGVGDGDAPRHLTVAQRSLRNRLRAHGRQLGDQRDEKRGTQAIRRLVQECAYEHWHRMLFARFLTDADLLREPQSSVTITLGEVRELARERSLDWLELASDFAASMLPEIFRKGDPVLEIPLPPETRSDLDDLLNNLPREVFLSDDSLGWVYQFWQADRKGEINESEVKIGAEELPAVTQLFTEDYMVLFLLHNTLGAWWAAKVLGARPELAMSAKSEEDLRAACTIGNIDWIYLRFARDAEGAPWRPAAGGFDGWPRAAKDLTVLDPCMGSGHFLVFALQILVAFRMAEELLDPNAAVDATLRDNLFGLEIDPRCTQIAAFNLAFAAWRMGGYRLLPRLNLACSGLSIGATKAEWLTLAERAAEIVSSKPNRDAPERGNSVTASGVSERIANGLEQLYDLFDKGPWLGSLIDPRRVGGDLLTADFAQLEPLLAQILMTANGDELAEMAVAAEGMTRAVELLGRSFTLVATNVPYLGRGKQDDVLKEYCGTTYPRAKADLSACFVERCIEYCQSDGTAALVTPQNWLFLGTYQNLRRELLKTTRWDFVAKLGPAAFEDMNWWAANTTLVTVSNASARECHLISGIDVSPPREPQEKAERLKRQEIVTVLQAAQEKNPDARLLLTYLPDHPLLERVADSYQGISPADFAHYGRYFWELRDFDEWKFWQGTVNETIEYGGRELVLWWNADLARAVETNSAFIRGDKAWGHLGVVVRQMRHLPCTLYTGEVFDTNCAVIIPHDANLVPALWAFCSSGEFAALVRELDQKTNVTNATLVKVPFEIDRWRSDAKSRFPSGLPVPESDDASQWLFNGDARVAMQPLQVAVARLLGFVWPRQLGVSFVDCGQVAADALESHADDGGIVCLTAAKGEAPAERRLNAVLSEAFRGDWSAAMLTSLLADVGFAAKTLDDWLRDGFFQQHCELFHQRPFIWHIWDGRRDGFHALVNYHRLAAPGGEGRRSLERLIYSYLGDWIDRQRADQKAGVEGADARVAAAQHLHAELSRILEGEPPFDIFVRWKALHEQAIGWDPDINDGVRMNMRPFMAARPLGARGANACILRVTPKIKWDKDRGKESIREKVDFPWFWRWNKRAQDFGGGSAFDGNRWNDVHYSRATKEVARDGHAATNSEKA